MNITYGVLKFNLKYVFIYGNAGFFFLFHSFYIIWKALRVIIGFSRKYSAESINVTSYLIE